MTPPHPQLPLLSPCADRSDTVADTGRPCLQFPHRLPLAILCLLIIGSSLLFSLLSETTNCMDRQCTDTFWFGAAVLYICQVCTNLYCDDSPLTLIRRLPAVLFLPPSNKHMVKVWLESCDFRWRVFLNTPRCRWYPRAARHGWSSNKVSYTIISRDWTNTY